MRNFLSITSISLEDMHRLYRMAFLLEAVAEGKKKLKLLDGAVLANLFFEPSTRTRLSFHSAFLRLGGDVITLDDVQGSSFVKGESVADAARVISQYCDISVIRHALPEVVKDYAEASYCPVINGGSGAEEHPTQALLDVYTIHKELSRLKKGDSLEFDGISGRVIVFGGDLKYGRTVHSLIRALSCYENMTFICYAPPFLQLPEGLKEEIVRKGHHVIETSHKEDLKNADVFYSTRLQKERHEEGMFAPYDLASYQLNDAFISSYLSDQVIVMHPLPRDAREGAYDLCSSLDHREGFAIFRQSGYGVPVRMALFLDMMGFSLEDIQHALKDVAWSV